MKENKKMVNPSVNSVPDVDDGVCEGEYRHPYPTQEEIIAFNRKEYSASIDGPGIPINPGGDGIGENTQWDQKVTNPNTQWDKDKMVLVEKDLLEKLKDFDYWKEWRDQK